MQFYIATASDADTSDMEWESLQDLEVSIEYYQYIILNQLFDLI